MAQIEVARLAAAGRSHPRRPFSAERDEVMGEIRDLVARSGLSQQDGSRAIRDDSN
jgi:hypothetical protein